MGLKISRQTDLTALFDQFAIDPLTKEKQTSEPKEQKEQKNKTSKKQKN